MSDSERPEIVAFRELRLLVGQLTEELAGFRRRALQAEAKVRELEATKVAVLAGAPSEAGRDRVTELERENAELRGRLDAARSRTQAMLERMRFVRQQHERGVER